MRSSKVIKADPLRDLSGKVSERCKKLSENKFLFDLLIKVLKLAIYVWCRSYDLFNPIVFKESRELRLTTPGIEGTSTIRHDRFGTPVQADCILDRGDDIFDFLTICKTMIDDESRVIILHEEDVAFTFIDVLMFQVHVPEVISTAGFVKFKNWPI